MSKLISPTNDLVFKKVFASPSRAHKRVLMALIESVFPLELEDVTVLSPYQIETYSVPQEENLPYFTEVDLLAETSRGEMVTIELQVYHHKHFVTRTLYYLYKTFIDTYDARPLKRRSTMEQRFGTLKPIYGIYISNFSPMKADVQPKLLRSFELKECKDHDVLSEISDAVDLQAAYVDLSYDGPVEDQSDLYWFVRFLKDEPMLDSTPDIIKSAYDMVNQEAFTKEELTMIDRIKRQEIYAEEVIATAEQRASVKAKAEGRMEEANELIISMIEEGLSLHQIAKISKRSEEFILETAREHDLVLE